MIHDPIVVDLKPALAAFENSIPKQGDNTA